MITFTLLGSAFMIFLVFGVILLPIMFLLGLISIDVAVFSALFKNVPSILIVILIVILLIMFF